jgi:YHS domain-containing protein
VSDPVCGMLVNPAQAAASGNTLAYRGASHYFSSRQGKQAFQNDSGGSARTRPGDNDD